MRVRPDQHGAVLILVLWLTVVLTVLLGAFSLTVKVDRRVAEDALMQVREAAAREAVLSYLAGFHLADPERFQTSLGQTLIMPWPELPVRFRVLPESSRVSLNAAPEELIVLALEVLGTADPQLQAAAIIARRQLADAAEPADEFEQAGEQTGPWKSISELWIGVPELLGMPLAEVFSIHSQTSTVMQAFATPELAARVTGTEYAMDDSQAGNETIFRVQLEVGEGGRARKHAVTVSISGGRYQLLETYLYNAAFDLD